MRNNSASSTDPSNRELPDDVLRFYEAEGCHQKDLTVALYSDLSPEGHFGEQWLLIDEYFLRVLVRREGELSQRICLPFDRIQEARLEQCVGNGLLQVTVDESPQVVLHFSNELTDSFARVKHYLSQRVELGPTAPLPDFAAAERSCISCGRSLLDPSMKVCPRCIDRGKVMRRLLLMAKPYWGKGAIHLGQLLVGVGIDLLPPYFTKILIDALMTGGASQNWLIGLVLSLLASRIARVIVTISDSLLANRVSVGFASEVREKMFSHLKTLSVDFFDRNQSGRLLTRINHDTEELQGLINQMATFAMNVVLVIAIGVVLFGMSPSLGLFVLIPTPFVVAAAMIYNRWMRPHFRRYWVTRWRLNAMLSTFLQGVHVVKAFAQEDREEARYRERNQTTLDARLRVDLAWSRFFPLISFAFNAGGLIIWYSGGRAVLEDRISLGTLMAFLSYLGMFYGPLSNLATISQSVNRFATISQRIFEFLDESPTVPTGANLSCSRPIGGAVELDHVTFGYDPYFPIVKDVTLTIRAGEHIGIVGPSGAGKTTLASLVCRFYDVTEGSISIDEVDIRDLSTDYLRSNIGIVLQATFLFRGTLAENIAYGRPDASRDEIIHAAKAANAHEFIVHFPEGYDTIVGEGGTGLSGGERQRISIARAILQNPRILILDEATSSVDTETERQIQGALETLIAGRTTISIAHRLSTLYNADRVVVLDHGRIVEVGAPVDLMSSKGMFYRLVKMQTQFARLDGSVPL